MSFAAVALVLSTSATASGTASAREALLRQSLQELHEERFPAAIASAARLREMWPGDPAGSLVEANVYQTMMRDYRVRAFEAPFRSALDQALVLAERAVRERPSAEAYFTRGTARAYRAVHRFTSGDWVPALFDAMRGVRDARRALDLDAAFVDPLLATALHDFWKADKLGVARIFVGGRSTVVARLERVRREGRLLGVEATYALQTVHYKQRNFAQALEVNDSLFARFPTNPVCLYHRALILEALDRPEDALAAWDALRARLETLPHRSDGFLAECHLHRARILARHGRSVEGDDHARQAREAAKVHAARRDGSRELEGPLVPFAEVRAQVARLDRTLPAPAPAAVRR